MKARVVRVVYLLCIEIMIFVFHCHLSFFLFCLSFFSPSSRSIVVCENREEPWSWFQYLWWHQWPGEPLQTLRHGTTRPGLPANHSLPGFTSELPWKLLLATAVFRLSVCLSVCGAAVNLVNFKSVILYYRLLIEVYMFEGVKKSENMELILNIEILERLLSVTKQERRHHRNET